MYYNKLTNFAPSFVKHGTKSIYQIYHFDGGFMCHRHRFCTKY